MSDANSVVTIGTASIRGIARTDGGCEFRGIQYATAKRFSDPVDVDVIGKIDATEYGDVAPQIPGFLEQTVGLDSSSMSDDCLYLNIYTLPHVKADAKLPVLFWIHGGAYTNGAGSLSWYHGSRLALRDCIVVTINYRLGLLGFLGESNLGVKDMVSALRWTNKYISHFGGDPENISIFGESAGGSAVVSLMATPSAEPLFRKAWAMSPSIGQLRSSARAREIQDIIFSHASVSTIADLEAMTFEQLLDIQTAILGMTSTEFDWFAPTYNTEYIPEHILEVAARSPKPFVIGTNKDENKLWAAFDPKASDVTEDDWHKHLTKIFGSQQDEADKVYRQLRVGESPHFLISAVNTDVGFRARAWSLVDQRIDNKVPTWMYWFTWQTPAFGGILGSCHALDIPFAFDNLDAPGGEMLTGDSPARFALASRFADELAHFATHGHPTWSQYDSVMRHTLQLDTAVTLVSDPENEIRKLFTTR